MVEEKLNYRYVGEHSQRQGRGHLGETRVDMITLSWALWERVRGREREKGKGGTRRSSQEAKGPKRGM